ncbi:MAG: ROK family transcriptional regulator [Gaiellaceae bacterium]
MRAGLGLRVNDDTRAFHMTFERGRHAAVRADQTTVRRANLGVVLRHIAEGEPCSRARVAAETGLTRGTVSSLVGELIDLRLLRETGEDESPGRVGRPAQTLELADTAVAVGLEVNVDYLAVSLEDLTGQIRFERQVFVDNRRSAPGPVLDRLVRMARQALDEAERQGLLVVGAGVAVPGLVGSEADVVLRAPNLGWTGVPVASELRKRLPSLQPIRIENEANLAALAEHWLGNARSSRNFIFVFGEIGVGSGIFVDGELFRGAHGFGGEFGHMTVDLAGGALCACGSRGCLETVVGQEVIARACGVEVASGGRVQSVTAELVRRAVDNDPLVHRTLDTVGSTLGAALASAVNLFDLDAVVLGGCFGPLAPWLTKSVRVALRDRVLSAEWSTCDVYPSALGELAAVRGAAAVILRDVLSAPWSVGERRIAVIEAAS